MWQIKNTATSIRSVCCFCDGCCSPSFCLISTTLILQGPGGDENTKADDNVESRIIATKARSDVNEIAPRNNKRQGSDTVLLEMQEGARKTNAQKRKKENEPSWTDLLTEFINNGLFREKKVIFQSKELEIGGSIFQRVKLQFQHGLARNAYKVRLDTNSPTVKSWWENSGRKTVHEKLNQKKSGALCAIKGSMKGKMLWTGSGRHGRQYENFSSNRLFLV